MKIILIYLIIGTIYTLWILNAAEKVGDQIKKDILPIVVVIWILTWPLMIEWLIRGLFSDEFAAKKSEEAEEFKGKYVEKIES